MIRWREWSAVGPALVGLLLLWVVDGRRVHAADAPNLYVVRDIEVDVTAATAAEAREQALAEAERRAFQVMIDRLTLQRDRASAKRFADGEIASATRDFWVSREKVSPVRYLATLNYQFRPERVSALLRAKGIPFVATTAPKVLVVPVLWQGEKAAPGGADPWLAAWSSLVPEGLLPIVVDGGDASTPPEKLLAADEAVLAGLTARHGVADVLVVIAAPDSKPDPGGADPTQAGAAGYSLPVIAKRRLTFRPATQSEEVFVGTADETVQRLYARAAAAMLASLERDWKESRLAIVAEGEVGVTAIDVAAADLKSWLTIRRRLEAIPSVRRVDVVMFSRTVVRVNLHHHGPADDLSARLTAAGFLVDPAPPVWTLSAATGSSLGLRSN
jgi:hypothetical protein